MPFVFLDLSLKEEKSNPEAEANFQVPVNAVNAVSRICSKNKTSFFLLQTQKLASSLSQ